MWRHTSLCTHQRRKLEGGTNNKEQRCNARRETWDIRDVVIEERQTDRSSVIVTVSPSPVFSVLCPRTQYTPRTHNTPHTRRQIAVCARVYTLKTSFSVYFESVQAARARDCCCCCIQVFVCARHVHLLSMCMFQILHYNGTLRA